MSILTEQELILILLKELSGAMLIQEQGVHSLDVINVHLCTLGEGEEGVRIMRSMLLVSPSSSCM